MCVLVRVCVCVCVCACVCVCVCLLIAMRHFGGFFSYFGGLSKNASSSPSRRVNHAAGLGSLRASLNSDLFDWF